MAVNEFYEMCQLEKFPNLESFMEKVDLNNLDILMEMVLNAYPLKPIFLRPYDEQPRRFDILSGGERLATLLSLIEDQDRLNNLTEAERSVFWHYTLIVEHVTEPDTERIFDLYEKM